MEKFAIGMLLGCLGGALLTANNYKMRTLVRKGQEEVQTKVDQLLDEKIRKMDETVNAMEESAKEPEKKKKK